MSKNVMITGAGSGFGKQASIALAGRGHHVIATTETDEQAKALRAEAPELTVERVDITSVDDVAKVAAWEIDVLINNAGDAMRGELAPLGIDVTLLNPGPYQTGFNDRMADSMWEWFGDASLTASTTDVFKMMGELITAGQMDPAEVVQRMVELTEADTTTENNFVPPEIQDSIK